MYKKIFIRVNTPKESQKVQSLLFNMDCKWAAGKSEEPQHTDRKILVVSPEHKIITYVSSHDWVKPTEYKEISGADLMKVLVSGQELNSLIK